jgi:hypothetical protein
MAQRRYGTVPGDVLLAIVIVVDAVYVADLLVRLWG